MMIMSSRVKVREDIDVCRSRGTTLVSLASDQAELNTYVMEVTKAAVSEPGSLWDTLVTIFRSGEKSDKDR